ncbi:MAG: hypothetical protein KBD31_01150 [Proteobacteria bacterium]|nr:hypothetical protein [Pseudomonadota bacterium]
MKFENNIPTIYTSPDRFYAEQRAKIEKEKIEVSELIKNNGHGAKFSDYQNASQIIDLEIKQNQTNGYIQASEKMSQKLNSVTDVISKTHNLMLKFKQELMTVRNSKESQHNNFQSNIQDIYNQLEQILINPFMGGTTELYNDQSVDFSLLTNPPSESLADYSYCLGCESGTNVHIDNTNTLWDISGVTAKDPLFEQFIRSIRLAKLGNETDPKDAYFSKALDLLNVAEQDANNALSSTKQLKETIDEKISIMTSDNEKRQELYETVAVKSLPELIILQAMLNNDLETYYSTHVREMLSMQTLSQITQKLI